MSASNLFLTSGTADKKAYVEMMGAMVDAIASAMDHPKAYAGMGPYELRAAVHTDELLPEKGCGFEAILEEVKARILPNLVRPMSTDYMAQHFSAVQESCFLPEERQPCFGHFGSGFLVTEQSHGHGSFLGSILDHLP